MVTFDIEPAVFTNQFFYATYSHNSVDRGDRQTCMW